ncbi:hypothetical protein FPE09_004207 [Salmonella enterica subsp. enterica serovar Braenderup]|nr:hypothetical protein [Salmonella enterica subsp. enterica serovar Braenderup]EBQ9103909.1 hypothetical protein [Salmonella enterica subsp. enterica serovar Tennessee]EBW6850942.1 hypothetical protein [Salmonella enterica subsp. enterica serovar Braenderup]EEF3729717.1 hypothetical protein [Salmonella enterica subsp. enterica serovar Braenderup]EEJ6503124.1 hypothetical protein [Salmonella enterica subsp. enterica serovar Braenderup]
MTKITRERLLKIQQWRETYGTGSNVMLPAEEAEELARIALVSLTAEPVAWRLLDSPESSVTVTDNEKMAAIWKRNGRNVQPLYSTAHGSADAVGMVVSEGRQPSAHNPDSRIFEVLVESGYEPVPGDKLYAAPPAPVVPDDWVMVPKEPTRQMMAQGHFAMKGTDRGKFRRIYQAMITAAPDLNKGGINAE